MADQTLRFEDYTGKGEQPLAGCWWYCQAADTGVAIAIENPRMEPDDDGDHVFHSPGYDSLRLLDTGVWRELTGDESDEYVDDVYAWLRACDWEV